MRQISSCSQDTGNTFDVQVWIKTKSNRRKPICVIIVMGFCHVRGDFLKGQIFWVFCPVVLLGPTISQNIVLFSLVDLKSLRDLTPQFTPCKLWSYTNLIWFDLEFKKKKRYFWANPTIHIPNLYFMFLTATAVSFYFADEAFKKSNEPTSDSIFKYTLILCLCYSLT